MKLLIISHTPHYIKGGKSAGWAATVNEIDRIAEVFESVTHLAPLHPGPAPKSSAFYGAPNVRLSFVRPSGGSGLLEKIGAVCAVPAYAAAILRELKRCDAVHVRCPAGISLLALIVLCFTRHPEKRWIKYAGNWKPAGPEPFSYTLQRRFLKNNFCRSAVTVNGEWPDQPTHVRSFFNPSFSERYLDGARAEAEKKNLVSPVRLLFAGRLETEKGAGRALSVLAALRKAGVDAVIDLIGDGPGKGGMENLARSLGVADRARFHGWLSRPDLNIFYREAHFMLLPTEASEGWPKVLSEAMAHGAVVLSSPVSCIPQYLKRFGTGRVIDASDDPAYAAAVQEYLRNPAKWRRDSANAVKAAGNFTYEKYIGEIRGLNLA